jgi:pimeloyl-ACP methyl ester carboxylesterase
LAQKTVRTIQQAHLPARPLPSNGYALTLMPALNPSGKAILFVHGYSGSAATWRDFPTLLGMDTDVAGCDVFVYTYDGLYSELTASALIFRGCLERLTGDLAGTVNSGLAPEHHRRPGFKYDQIFIVGHSLGAVIARSALLYALENGAAWPRACRMMFFAPAHRGAHVKSLAADAFSDVPVLRALFTLGRFRSPLIDQLAEDSDTLVELQRRTAKASGGALTSCVRPVKVVIADRERIVVNLPFPGDPTPVPIPGTTHKTVCKPRLDFTAPYDQLKDVL